ncbi:hypothetical protein LCGC14_1863060 [marine sediment metagenome]|uniref:Rhodanese domain-containing protein n=1 Tax=marine sediment metagenome TaxID=412755 RepID=A0A0F9ILD1_9ZZZZ
MREGMIKPWVLIAPLALLVGVAVACGPDELEEGPGDRAPIPAVGQVVETEDGFYVDVTPQELQPMLGGRDFPLVNVHVPYEGEIEGTDLFIAYDRIADRLGELPSELDSKIVVYCRSGGMSAIAASALVSAGYTNVWNLDGGMIAWQEVGYPLLNAGQ